MMKFLKTYSFYLLLFHLASVQPLQAEIPVVTNVVALQRIGTKLVDINYDLSDAEGDLITIRVEISADGGLNYNVPAFSLTGDIGSGITPGTNKVIVWNAEQDWDGEYSEQMRVKIIASDMRGLPGLEFGREVPPGGFLLGQDGGAEGVGPARHVNIPWSFWLSKYEITVGQFSEFLNTALAGGEIARTANSVTANPGIYIGINGGTTIYTFNEDIFWNLNRIVVGEGKTNLPAVVSWQGALAFCQHYGYDLPTYAEWEKAARGADHDGLGEHLVYPWGNSISGINANYAGSGDTFEPGGRTPVGYYDGNQAPAGPDMANDYGLYDIIGNVAEWTRTLSVTVENYPQLESLSNAIHSLTPSGSRIRRGGGASDGANSVVLKIYFNNGGGPIGFRVARRSQ